MNTLKYPYQLISVFTDAKSGLAGNISAVTEVDEMPTTEVMQRIARDLHQPATTFLAPPDAEGVHKVRWFAPDAEIGLCGHGTAAAVAYLSEKTGPGRFAFRAGDYILSGKGDPARRSFEINLDAIPVISELPVPEALTEGLGIKIKAHFSTGNKNIVLVESAEALRDMKPQFHTLRTLDYFGYAVTAPDDGDCDFVSRTLVPHVGQLEDHATGSSHAALVPFWAERTGKSSMSARQLSPRGGLFSCGFSDHTVSLGGTYEVLAEGFVLV
ncbi:MAG: PhzF family phenazine biosynthesis protein [Cryomorphaceae bacterium]